MHVPDIRTLGSDSLMHPNPATDEGYTGGFAVAAALGGAPIRVGVGGVLTVSELSAWFEHNPTHTHTHTHTRRFCTDFFGGCARCGMIL